jgi:glycosyltransferase involved in cell wall biosynthesis
MDASVHSTIRQAPPRDGVPQVVAIHTVPGGPCLLYFGLLYFEHLPALGADAEATFMKIAIVYPEFYTVAGIARYLESFLGNLPKDSPPIMVITGTPIGAPRSFAGVEMVHVPLSANRASLLGWGLAVRALLIRLYAEGRITCVNFHIPPLIPGLVLPAHIPMILTAHTTYLGMSGRFYPERHYRSQWNAAALAIKMWMERRILAGTSKVIALTEQGRAEVMLYGFKGPIAVVANGADTAHFHPEPAATKDVDVLFAGRIERRKGSRPMVELCKLLVAARPSIRIEIIGYGDDDAWVRSELGPLQPAVHMAGKTPFAQMNAQYNRSRVYVSTSYYEGLPGTCLEAMAAGLPAVVWDFPFYQGLVQDGRTGYIVKPNDLGAMRDKVLALIDDPRAAQLGQAGREWLVSRYDWHTLARQIVHELAAPM